MPIFTTYKQRAMVDMHTIADLAIFENGIVKCAVEVRLYVGPTGAELANDTARRFLCLTQIANSTNITTADIERLCQQVTGAIPTPFDIGQTSTGM